MTGERWATDAPVRSTGCPQARPVDRSVIIGGKQVISVDPRRRLVALETISRFGTRTRLIPFNLIAETFVGELGDKEGGSVSYHVVLKLNDGKEVALFIGAFEGTFNRPAMEARCNRINEYLRNQ